MAGPDNLFRQTITYAAEAGRNAYGKPTMGAQSTAAARVQPMRKFVRDAQGNEVATSHVVYTAAALGFNHRVWFPGDNTSDFNASRRPLAIDTHVDGGGTTRFYKVYF